MPTEVPPRAVPLLLLGVLAACRTPEEYRLDADEEVYALIDARRDELFAEAGGFRIEPPTDSVRQRILRGEWNLEQDLTMVQVLRIAAENSRDYQTQKESLYRVALDLTLERWRFSNQPFASGGADLDGGKRAENASADGEAGITRLLGNGASIVANIGADLFRVVSTRDGWDLVSDLGLSITQPLLRGAGKRIVQEPLTQAERDLVYEVRSFERFRRSFGVDVAGRVYDLLQAQDELANEERNYDNLVDLSERNEAMAEAGRLSDIDADQAKQDELRSEATLVRLRGSLERQWDQFNLFLGLPVDAELRLDPGEFERLTDHDALLDLLEEGRAVSYALESRLDHQTTLDQVDDRKRSVAIAEDALRAGLSLSASANQNSREGRPFDYDSDDLSWSLGFSFDAPLDRKAERNAYRSSLISLQSSLRGADEAADRIQADVLDAFRNAANARADLVIQRGAVELNRRRVESTKLNLDAGRTDTFDVLLAQEALVNAENAATSALINFTLARLELYLQLELLRVDDGGIQIEDRLAPVLLEDE